MRPADERWPANLWQVYRPTNPGKAQTCLDVLRRLAAVNPRAMELAVLAEIGQMEDQVRRGDVRSAMAELARLRGRAMEGSTPWYSMMISSAHLALGKLADAEAICERLDGRIRAECLLRIAHVRHDANRAQEEISTLGRLGPSDRGRVQDMALAAVTGDNQTALAWLPPQESRTIEGFVLLNRGETREAVSAFRNEHPEVTPGWTLRNRYGLALALERDGRAAGRRGASRGRDPAGPGGGRRGTSGGRAAQVAVGVRRRAPTSVAEWRFRLHQLRTLSKGS